MQTPDWNYIPNCRIPENQTLPEGVIRYAAIVSYDGSEFCGFQRQKHSPSVQVVLEKALSYVADESVTVGCAGRTDTAVHASYQVVHFDCTAKRDGRNWVMGANSKLPDSVALVWAGLVGCDFHARFSALSRTYRYVMVAQETRPAILSTGVTWVKYPLRGDLMETACQFLLGEQDFSAFRGAGCQSLSPFRNVEKATVYESSNLLVFEITANAFLLHMVRNIVGSLMEVGLSRRPASWIKELLDGGDRCKSAATAPPNGLYLVDVTYPDIAEIPELPKGPLFLPAFTTRGI
ncbi:MAG: tRNA pseudouridine(38-40) synthase TruA [Porticoccaceae bacterium]|nr:tRNA pseudouridine(38-40) synthase TruA [Porticoccaceae bacterium]